MDPILQVLLSWQFLLFGLAVAVVIYVIRLVVEYLASILKKDLTTSKLWNNLVLPLAPIVIGVVAGIVFKKFPYPGFIPDANGIFLESNRIIFGLVAGSFSTVMYRVIKSLLYQKMVSFAQNLSGATGTTISTTQTVSTEQTEQIDTQHLPPKGQI